MWAPATRYPVTPLTWPRAARHAQRTPTPPRARPRIRVYVPTRPPTHTLMQVRTHSLAQALRRTGAIARLRTLAPAYAPIRPQRTSLAAMRRVRPTHTCARPRFSRAPTLSASTKKTTVGVGRDGRPRNFACSPTLAHSPPARLLGAHEDLTCMPTDCLGRVTFRV